MPIVTGRFNGIDLEKRLCTLCDSSQIGDEPHYVFNCDYFNAERAIYIKKNERNGIGANKMKDLFQSENVSILVNLAKFVQIIMNKFAKEEV